jgi:FAD-dependent urate hydroxylase
MRVLVVGAGIGGLALSAHLQKAGHEVVIVEQARKLEKTGFVLGLWGAGLKTLENFGVEGRIRQAGHFPTALDFRNQRGRLVRRFHFERFIKKHGAAVIILRSDFYQILLDLNKQTDIRLDTSVTSIQQKTDGCSVGFTDGRTQRFDLVVGADGLHSKVRELVFGAGHVRYSGLTSWVLMTDGSPPLRPNLTEMWVGGKFFGVYPFTGGRVCAILAMRCEQGTFTNAEARDVIQREFGEFGWLARDILGNLPSTAHIYHTDWNEVSLPSAIKGRVVLIGDASHAMLPTAGSGASMALEDAYWLAMELRAHAQDVPTALARFAARRQPAVRALKMHTTVMARLIQLSGPAGRIRDALMRRIPARLVELDLKHLMRIQDKDRQKDYYRLASTWQFAASAQAVRQAFLDYRHWPDWWPMIRHVQLHAPQQGRALLDCRLGFWPHQLNLRVKEVSAANSQLVLSVTGDLCGTATIRLVPHKSTTKMVIDWEVLVIKSWMRRSPRLLRPLFIALHNAVMTSGARGLAKQLGRQKP